MPFDRVSRILTQLSQRSDAHPKGQRLCEVAADVTDVSGAGIMLLVGDRPHGSLCSTDSVSKTIEDLQYMLGDGPCVEAHHKGTVILEPNLAAPEEPRWHAFTPPAVEAGARAVFGFPLRVGAARLGALNLYRDRPGPLSDEQHADALAMADIAARAILAMQADTPPGEIAVELAGAADFHYVVHQAAGMVSTQLTISVGEAFVRLRAFAFASERTIDEVARDVVDRRIHFHADDA